MKTLDQILEQFTGPFILEDLADLMRTHDSSFLRCEDNYKRAVAYLRNNTEESIVPSIDEYLDACQKEVIYNLLYSAYHGYRINLENFHSPYAIKFEWTDFTDYIRDHLIGHCPYSSQARSAQEAFRMALPDRFKPLTNPISSYFIALDVTGTKLAHYAGYVIANKLLPLVEPGYREDYCQTLHYSKELKKYIGYLPF